ATGAPGKAQPFTAQQSAGSKRRVDQIALPSPPLPSTWTLTLKDLDARTDQEASQPGPIAPRALDREHGRPELARPREQAPITRRRRRDLAAVELSAERVQPDGDVHLLVRVDTDRHRPLHDLTSGSSRWSTGLGQGCVGQKTHASIRSPASRAKRRRETGRIQGKSPPASLRVIPPPLRTLGSPSDRDRHAATLHSIVERSPPTSERLSERERTPNVAIVATPRKADRPLALSATTADNDDPICRRRDRAGPSTVASEALRALTHRERRPEAARDLATAVPAVRSRGTLGIWPLREPNPTNTARPQPRGGCRVAVRAVL